VAKRLRFLRAGETQEVFAARVGVSRSALANYETGRSQPDDYTIAKIAKNAGVSEDYFSAHYDPWEGSWVASVGAAIEGVPDWTDDEASLVRMVRICDPETICSAIATVLNGVSQKEVTVPMSTILTITDDVEALLDVQEGKRPFEKGALATYPEDSPKHRLGFAGRKKTVPQSDAIPTKSKA
jgi:DNA-binding XRE family transcriptional regulator